MPALKIRYFVEKLSTDGSSRFYWQPSRELVARGYRLVRLGHDRQRAIAAAQRLNVQLDADRRGEPSRTVLRRARPEDDGGVYVMGTAAGPVKVGRSKRPWARAGDLRSGSLVKLDLLFFARCLRGRVEDVERAAHVLLHEHHLVTDGVARREWFAVPAEVAIDAVITALKMQPPSVASWTVASTDPERSRSVVFDDDAPPLT